MKKVLFATTALVASAGIAAAEIEFGLSAEMGVVGGDRYDDPTTPDNDEGDLQFHNDFTISIDGSGETDNGLTFGMHIEIEESNGADDVNGDASYDNEAVFISGAFGTLTLGEIDGAFDKRLQEVALAGGSIDDSETEHSGYNGNGGTDGVYDNQVLRYDYSFDAFGFSLSMEQDDDDLDGADDIYQLGLSYDVDAGGIALGFGLGYATGYEDVDGDDAEVIGVSIDADFGNGFVAAINYSDLDEIVVKGGAKDNHYGIGIGYTMDALSIGLNYGVFEASSGAGDDSEGYGLIVNYDLGGGAVVQFGYGEGDNTDGTDFESYSLGLALSF